MGVLVIDYGMGNLGSVRRAVEECGADVFVSADPDELKHADRIILPGVGAFPDAMARLNERGWPEALKNTLQNQNVTMLGICLGMQLLADKGTEGGEHQGLGLISGDVIRLQPESGERVPHVGWNELNVVHPSSLVDGIPDGTDFYFVHSYHFSVANEADVIARSPYCGQVVSVVGSGNVFGAQFHPEKSGRPGFKMLQNFLEL